MAKRELKDEQIMDKRGACDFLRISARSLDYMMATQSIPFKRMGKRIYRFDREQLLEWVRKGNTRQLVNR